MCSLDDNTLDSNKKLGVTSMVAYSRKPYII